MIVSLKLDGRLLRRQVGAASKENRLKELKELVDGQGKYESIKGTGPVRRQQVNNAKI